MDQETFDLIKSYRTPQQVIEKLRNIPTVILTGITSAGKNTIMQHMLETDQFTRVVTSTTRSPRKNSGILEQDGREYYFFTTEQARQKIKNGEYIEVNNVHERINGSLVAEYERIAASGHIALTDVDFQGASQFLDFGMNKLLVVFIVPPSFEVWLERLKGRYDGSLEGHREDIAIRFRSAQREIKHALNDPRFIPVMNINSRDSANQIMALAHSANPLSDREIAEAHTTLQSLYDGLENYIDLISD